MLTLIDYTPCLCCSSSLRTYYVLQYPWTFRRSLKILLKTKTRLIFHDSKIHNFFIFEQDKPSCTYTYTVYEPLPIFNCKVEPLHEPHSGAVQEHLNSTICSMKRFINIHDYHMTFFLFHQPRHQLTVKLHTRGTLHMMQCSGCILCFLT